jgi:hypothetical protein
MCWSGLCDDGSVGKEASKNEANEETNPNVYDQSPGTSEFQNFFILKPTDYENEAGASRRKNFLGRGVWYLKAQMADWRILIES